MNNYLACVYLTTYYGDKMPNFYIGSTYIHKINNGYRGSVSSRRYKEIWISELKHNPDLFETIPVIIVTCRNVASELELLIQRELNVVQSGNFINMGYASKNFNDISIEPWNKGLTKDTDNRVLEYTDKMIQTKLKNNIPWIRSEEYINKLTNRMINNNPAKCDSVRAKLRITSSGENNGMYGVTGEKHPMYNKSHSIEAKNKIRDAQINAHKNRSSKEKARISEESSIRASKSRWFWDPLTGKTSFSIPGNEPYGFIKGRGPRKKDYSK